MKTKKYLVSTLLASTLILGGAMLSPVQAADKSLEPQGGWSISKVDRTAQGGNSYCTLSRKYDDNIILSLGRNTAEEYSLAIDFQKEVFDKDKALKINLQPGPGKLRAYDLLPASQKAVVVRLGWDEGFFETLNASQKMDVKIGDNSYAFAMPLIAKGQADLEDCMEGLKTAAKGPTPANIVPSKDVLNAEPMKTSKAFDASRVAEAAASVEEQEKQIVRNFAQSMEAQEEAVNGKKSNFNKGEPSIANAKPQPEQKPALVARAEPLDLTAPTNAAAAAALDAINTASGSSPVPAVPAPVVEAAPAPAPAAQQSAGYNKAQTEAMEKQIAQLNAQNAELKGKADAGNTSQVKNQEQMAAMQKQIGDLMTENAGLKTQAEAATKGAAHIVQLQKQNADLTMQNAALLAKAGTADQGSAKIAELEKQILAYKAKEAAPATITALPEDTARIGELQKQLDAISNENAKLKAQAQTAATPAAPLAQDAARITELEKRVTDLNNENAALKAAANATGDSGSQKAKIAELETKNKSLQGRLDAVALEASQHPDAADIASYQDQVKELQAKNKQLEESLRTAQTKIAEAAIGAESQSLKTIAELEVKLEATKKDNLSLSSELNDLKNKQDDTRVSLASGNWDLEQATKRFNEAERENKRMGRELEQARMACNVEKAKIEQMLFDPAVADQKQIERLSELQEELDQARAQLGARGGSRPAVPVPSVEISSVDDAGWQAERARLQSRINALENDEKFTGITQLPDNAASIASAKLEADRLKRENEMKNNQTITYQNQLIALRKENEKLRAAGSSNAAPVPPRAPDRSASAERVASVEPAAGDSKDNSYDASSLKSLLQKAGVVTGGVQKASSGMAGAQNYSWSGKNGIRGASSVKQMNSPAEFEGLVNEYIAARKAECGGDFASIPSQAGSSAKKMALFETACVGGDKSGSASTVFFTEQGRFVAISSGAGTDNMDQAMDSRDRIASALGQ